MAAITLNEIRREDMLRYAHGLVRNQRTWRHTPLWSFVRNVCGVGSTSGAAICRELGWDPNAMTRDPLPRRSNQLNEYPLAEQAGEKLQQRLAGMREGDVGIGRTDAAEGAAIHRPAALSLSEHIANGSAPRSLSP